NAHRHLPGRPKELDLLALYELDLATRLLVDDLLNSGYGKPDCESVVMDARYDSFAEHCSAQRLHALAYCLGCRLTALQIRSEPQLDLAVDVLGVVSDARGPVFEHAGFLKSILHSPPAYVA